MEQMYESINEFVLDILIEYQWLVNDTLYQRSVIGIRQYALI